MRVKDLIEILESYPEDADVIIGDDCADYFYSWQGEMTARHINYEDAENRLYIGDFDKYDR